VQQRGFAAWRRFSGLLRARRSEVEHVSGVSGVFSGVTGSEECHEYITGVPLFLQHQCYVTEMRSEVVHRCFALRLFEEVGSEVAQRVGELPGEVRELEMFVTKTMRGALGGFEELFDTARDDTRELLELPAGEVGELTHCVEPGDVFSECVHQY
jgi:hypothetical protein